MSQHAGQGAARRVRRGAVAVVVAALVGTALAVAPAGPVVARPGVDRTPDRLDDRLDERVGSASAFALRQLERTERRLPPGLFPTVAVEGRPWRTSSTNGWLAGFYPARLWLAHQADGRVAWARRAARRQAPLTVRQDDTSTHDLGFLLHTSFGAGVRLTGSEADAAVVLRAAGALASRWVPEASAIRSWDGPGDQTTVIVDSLVNLELLSAAVALGGDPRWRALARAHARTVAREHLRPDGSTTHVVRFAPGTGTPVWRGTHQGLHDTSTWARGQSWAVYGFTAAWRDLRDPVLLDAARRTAGFALARLPRDGVPRWDYDAPRSAPRDTTAAAALASGLLELARVDPDRGLRSRWAAGGLHVLRSLTGPRYLARGTGSSAILLHGHHDARYADAGVTYGDHYLLEALLRTRLLPSGRRPVPGQVARGVDGRARLDLDRPAVVTGVSVRWRDGARRATRFRVETSVDGRTWRRAATGVSSGRTGRAETYDLPDRRVGAVRVRVLGTGRVTSVVARGVERRPPRA